ncbi:MAG: tetratricopeptide repeat protein [Spirochaetales bacterium]|nr:tetratricopeptide repeat protein [Spirochaetales bacterium]
MSDFFKGLFQRAIQEEIQRRRQEELQKEILKRIKEKEQKALSVLYRILFIAAIVALVYSLLFILFPQLKLPNFPFMYYTIGYACFVIVALFSILLSIRSFIKIPFMVYLKMFYFNYLRNLFGLVIILINFANPGFRNIFFSHFDDINMNVIILILLFIVSNMASFNVMRSFTFNNVLNWYIKKFSSMSIKNNRELLQVRSGIFKVSNLASYVLAIIIYFGLLSPFHLGVLKPMGFVKTNPEIYNVDSVYYEHIITEDMADRQAGLLYFLEGKRSASLGNKTGYDKSIESYEMALELLPDFSTCHAEIAYSYASIGKILEMAKKDSLTIQDYYLKANESLDYAMNINSDNPITFAVKAIIEFYKGNKEASENSLKNAVTLSEEKGFGDRVLQAMALLTNNKVKRIEYLLGIQKGMKVETNNPELKDLYLNSAEITNMLGIAYYLINDKENAKASFERAIRLNPDFGEAQLNISLVLPENQRTKNYKTAAEKDNEVKLLANYYTVLFEVQRWTVIVYVFLLLVFLNMQSILKKKILNIKKLDLNVYALMLGYEKRMVLGVEYRRENRKLFSVFFSLFIVSYVIFELVIHIFMPINSITHMFPINFPFF